MPPSNLPKSRKDSAGSELEVALGSTLAIASVGIATLKMLETLLPAAAEEVEQQSKDLTEYFMTLAHYIETEGHAVPKEVAEAVSGIVMCMQFQDRNTQIMENVVCILERYRSMLEEVCGNIEAMRAGHTASGKAVSEAVDNILSGIRLSDIRHRYLESLAKAQVHSHNHHHVSQSDEEAETDTIELF